MIVVDGSVLPHPWPDRGDVRVVRCPPGTRVAVKRNLAIRHARGDAVTWFDDDDWQHPRKLSLLAAALRHGELAGNVRGWFVDLASGRARLHTNPPRAFVFNSLGISRALATAADFDRERHRASDTPWLAEVRRRAGRTAVQVDEPLFFWLCHERNLSNPAGRGRPHPHQLGAVRAAVGGPDWAGTDDRLEQLRSSLGPARRAAPRDAPRDAPEPAGPVGAPGTPPVGAGGTPPGDDHRRRRPPPVRRGRVGVVITTYNRPDSLDRLLDDIEAQRPAAGTSLSIHVFDDASDVGVDRTRARVRRLGGTYVRAARNHGKRGWWRWWNTILGHLRPLTADRYVVLQDDIRLCDRFLDRAESAWATIDDDRKASLFLHVDNYNKEPGRARWTPCDEVRVGGLINCGWVDLTAFLCERRLFEALGWRLRPNGGRWGSDPHLGSGVGAQVSNRLLRKGLTMYRVAESLTVHTDTPSMMNREARARWPVRTANFVDGDDAAERLASDRTRVHASLASVPARERQLGLVVERLLPQVDRLGVYLNGYARVPGFLGDRRIEVVESRSGGDRGDAGKFHWADGATGYVLTCDDDLDYPSDYVERLVAGIERYGRGAVVGFHGAILDEPLDDYLRSRRLLHFSRRLRDDTVVHILGTGVAGYHASTLRVRGTDFARPNMADVYLGLLGQAQQVPFVCLGHEAGWLRELPGTAAGSIYQRARRARGARTSPSEETALARRDGGWTLHSPRPLAPPVPQVVQAVQVVQGGPGSSSCAAGPGRLAQAAGELGPSVPVTVRGPRRRARLLLPRHDHITLAVQRSGTYYERDLLDRIRRLDLTGTYVDVGAHYGNHTLFFLLECGAEHVVAIEPNPGSRCGLQANAAENGVADRVTALPVAIHPHGDRVDLHDLPWTPRRSGGARTNSGRVGVRSADGRGAIAAARLDEALAPFERIVVLKVDAADHGAEILESGPRTLDRHRPVVAVEAATDPACGRVRRLLGPLGYEMVGRYCWTPTWLWVPARP